MYIIGNLYNKNNNDNKNNNMVLIVLSSIKLSNYKNFLKKSTHIVNDIYIHQYKIKINKIKINKIITETEIEKEINEKIEHIKNKIPKLENTSVYFVSCDGQNIKKYNVSNPIEVYNLKEGDDTDMWKKLYDDIEADQKIHKYVIHLGDQVYMDDAHDELIKSNTIDNKAIREAYYKVYETNYKNPYKKKVLETAYNVMIGDDHDYINNYKSVTNNLTPLMVSNVEEMYKIFQEDLYGAKEHNIKHLLFEDFQMIIPDLRKYRQLVDNTDTTTKYPIMGQKQMDDFNDIIKTTSDKIKRTYYVSTIPLVGVNKTLDKIIGFIYGDKTINIDDYIQSEKYEERKHIMNKLFELQNVTIIGGDYHYAEYYTFIRNNQQIRQIITSPISSDPVFLRSSFYKKIFGWILNKLFYDRIIDDITIVKNWFVFDYNYLKITKEEATLCTYNKDNTKHFPMLDVECSCVK